MAVIGLVLSMSCDSSPGPIAPTEVAQVSITPRSLSVIVGELGELTATVFDEEGNALSDREIAWSSNDSDVVVETQAGVVTGVALGGPAEVTATSEGISGMALITVTAPPAEGFPVYVPVRSRGLGIDEPEFIVELDEGRADRIGSGDGRYIFEGVELGEAHLELKKVPDNCNVYPGRELIAEVIEFSREGADTRSRGVPPNNLLRRLSCSALWLHRLE